MRLRLLFISKKMSKGFYPLNFVNECYLAVVVGVATNHELCLWSAGSGVPGSYPELLPSEIVLRRSQSVACRATLALAVLSCWLNTGPCKWLHGRKRGEREDDGWEFGNSTAAANKTGDRTVAKRQSGTCYCSGTPRPCSVSSWGSWGSCQFPSGTCEWNFPSRRVLMPVLRFRRLGHSISIAFCYQCAFLWYLFFDFVC